MRRTGHASDERDDRALVTAAQGGDRDALETLLRRHYDRVHAVCRRMLHHDQDAADATQEALLSAVRGLGRFDGSAAFGTWIYRIAVNACLDEMRRRGRRPTAPLEALDAMPDLLLSGDHRDAPFDLTVVNHLELQAALAQLPEEFQTAVVLRDVVDLDYAEIAATLDIPIGTVRSRIARGRAMLARALSSTPDGLPDAGNQPGNQIRTTERPKGQL